MLFDTETVPTRKELLVDLAAFGGTVVVAVVQNWKAADIVWASWIASLLIGLSFFLILSLKKLRDYTLAISEEESKGSPTWTGGNPGCLGLAVGALMALLAWLVGPGPARMTLCALVGLDVFALVITILAPRSWLGVSLQRPIVRAFFYLPTALYLFFFFLMHFGGFHLGHAIFLGFFVPPEVGFFVAADAVVGISEAPVDVREAWGAMREVLVGFREALGVFIGALILTYWPYILSVAVKSVEAYRAALLAQSKRGDEMILPYKNVIRVHLLIFALIPLAAFDSGIVMTIGVMVFFFFPVESLVAWFKSR